MDDVRRFCRLVLYVFGSQYEGCRAGEYSQLGCFFLALFGTWVQVLVFVVMTVGKLLVLVLP
jgi:hypothetical protein